MRDDDAAQIFGFRRDANARQMQPDGVIEAGPHDPVVRYIRSGKLLVSIVDSTGRERLCMQRSAGSLLGIEALHEPLEWSCELIALTQVELWELPLSTLVAALGEMPETRAALIRELGAIAYESMLERLILTSDATSRVARYLADAHRHDRLPSIVQRPKSVLARILQMRPETLSRVLRRLEQGGAIEAEPKLLVLDVASLESYVRD